MIKAVIFDMDGVIIDSEPLQYQAFLHCTGKVLGIHIGAEEFAEFIGTSNIHIYSTLKEKHNLQLSVQEMCHIHENQYINLLRQEKTIRPIDGADKLIQSLYQNGIKLAVASSSPMQHIGIVLDLFTLAACFAAKASGQECEHGKPAPDVFLRAAELLGVSPEDCLVIEDSRNGVAAAKAARMQCIAFYNPNSGNQDLSKADQIIKHFSEFDIQRVLQSKGGV